MNHQIICPTCSGSKLVKNGHTRKGKQRWRCRCCGRTFVLHPTNHRVSEETKRLIPLLLKERLSLRAIQRITKVSARWLYGYIDQLYAQIPKDLAFPVERILAMQDPEWVRGQVDELWSFVGSKQERQWVWLALDSKTRCIAACYVGKRTTKDAAQFWTAIPEAYREAAYFDSDYLKAYAQVIPQHQHCASGKETGYTAHIERFNCTLRQVSARLVRKALSFSKNINRHINAIKYVIWQYNLTTLSTLG